MAKLPSFIHHQVEDNSMTRSKVLENRGERQERGFTQHAVRRQDKGTLRSVRTATEPTRLTMTGDVVFNALVHHAYI